MESCIVQTYEDLIVWPLAFHVFKEKELFLVKGFMPMMAVDPCNPSAHNFGMHSFENISISTTSKKDCLEIQNNCSSMY